MAPKKSSSSHFFRGYGSPPRGTTGTAGTLPGAQQASSLRDDSYHGRESQVIWVKHGEFR